MSMGIGNEVIPLPVGIMPIVASAPTGNAAAIAAGVSLINGTQNILSWTAPNDGQLHTVEVIVNGYVSVAETGGAVGLSTTLPNGQAASPNLLAGGAGVGPLAGSALRVVEAGSTTTLQQTSALTVGTAVVWAVMRGY